MKLHDFGARPYINNSFYCSDMKLKHKHISSDERLSLLVYNDKNDWIIGFENSEWHTHGDMLMPEYGKTPHDATLNFMNAIIEDREIITISEFPDKPIYIRISDDPDMDLKYKLPDEKLHFRYWSGKKHSSQQGSSQGFGG